MVKSINEPETPTTAATEPESINEPTPAEPPVITALEPASCVIGDADFTLHVRGTGFKVDSVIHFAGQDEPTVFIDAGDITTGVKPSLWVAPALVDCMVLDGALESNVEEFEFLEAPVTRDTGESKRGYRKGW